MTTQKEEWMSAMLSQGRATTTVVEAAHFLGIDRNTAYRAVAQGDIPSFRIGKRILIPKWRLVALLDGNPPAKPQSNGDAP